MKEIAWRLGAAADWNTDTVLNAVPQLQYFNAGIWLDLEKKTARWADKYGAVWVITGPIFNNRKPSKTLGDKKEMKVAVDPARISGLIRVDPERKPVDPRQEIERFSLRACRPDEPDREAGGAHGAKRTPVRATNASR